MSDSGQDLQGTKMEYSAMLTHYGSPEEASSQEQLRYFLSTTEETVLGRAPECKIVLEPNRHTTVSRYHAKVRLLTNNSQPAWEICNLSTTNGTYVNGKQIEGCRILQPGDLIALSWQGPEFLFEYQSLPATILISSSAAGLEQQGSSPPTAEEQQEIEVPLSPVIEKQESEKETSLPTNEETSADPAPAKSKSQPDEAVSPLAAATSAVSKPQKPQLTTEVKLPSSDTPVIAEPEPVEQPQVVTSSPAAVSQQPASVSSATSTNPISPLPLPVGKSLWNLGTKDNIRTFSGHLDLVRAVAFSLDSQTLASGSADKTIKLWNVNTGQEIATLAGHKLQVNAVTFSSNSELLASGSADKTIKLWNVNTGEEISSLIGHVSTVNAVAFSSNGELLASGSADKTIKLWNLKTGQEICNIAGHKLGVNAVAFSSNGELLASGSADKTIKLWNVNTGEEISSLPAHRSAVTTVIFSPDSKTLASATEDKIIKLWNLAPVEEVYTLCGYAWQVGVIAISTDGQTLASGSQDKAIKLWRL